MNKNKNHYESLDFSNVIYVDLPKLEKLNLENSMKPPKYWNLYNEGVRLYNSKNYLRAKETFLKVKNFENPHKTFRTYLLRTYRKIIKEQMDSKNFQGAYDTFKEFFKFCDDEITNYDFRKYNKTIDNLQKINSNTKFKKIEIIKEPEIDIKGPYVNKLKLINKRSFKREDDPGIKNWNYLAFMKSNTLYAGRIYNKEFAIYDKTFLKIRNVYGDLINEFIIEGRISKFNFSVDSDKFVISTDNLILYFYSIKKGLINSIDLNSYTDDRYHLRCIDISPDGNFLLFTIIDSVYLMDVDLNLIKSWSTPHKEGLKKRKTRIPSDIKKVEENLTILNLSGSPSNKEIKNAFKKLVIRYHPDQNPDDKDANNKMRDLINAYEYLTSNKAEDVFEESKTEYYNFIEEFKIKIPNTGVSINVSVGITEHPEDWIYASYFGKKYIYLGCYSGKVYQISKDGIVRVVYNCNDVIRSIREEDEYLSIGIDDYLYFLKDNKYLKHIKIERNQDLIWLKTGLLLKSSNEINIFSNDGKYISEITFRNKINDIYLTKRGFNVLTNNRIYAFSLNILSQCELCGTKNPDLSNFCMECGRNL